MNILDRPTAPMWKKIGIYPHHGLNIFLPALHTAESCGIGEYLDLIPLIEYCREIGFDIIQISPVQDCGEDPSPYNPISAHALNPIYLSCRRLPYVDELLALRQAFHLFTPYIALPRIAFHAVRIAKLRWLRHYFASTQSYFSEDMNFAAFIAENPWLEMYALFKVLKELHPDCSWQNWPEKLRTLSVRKREELCKREAESIQFYTLLQYLCHIQLRQVRHHAEVNQIFLKGDLPFFVSRESVDVWRTPNLFKLRFTAGAPPDPLSSQQQNWGFPLFNWKKMQKQEYAFWRRRIGYLESFFHLLRVDHILGFFRTWRIPLQHPERRGNFLPARPHEWVMQGEHLLKMVLEAASVLLVGEDLGISVEGISYTLNSFGIPGTKVIRWQREYGAGGRYIPYAEYPENSLTTVSTHDCTTLTQWWAEGTEEVRSFADFCGWRYKAKLEPDRCFAILRQSHKSASLLHINLLHEYFALFPELVSPNPASERINIPGTTLLTNWTYRYRTPLEVWSQHRSLRAVFKEMSA